MVPFSFDTITSLAVWFLFTALWIAVPVGICTMLWRFLRAYERRSAAPGEMAELRARVLELERRVAELMTEQSRYAQAGQGSGAPQR